MIMSQMDKNIATNLKRIRKTRNMSLDTLAEKTGVSKSMLGQIERGESNPTVATIEKIVDGMKITFEDLIYPKEDTVMIIENHNSSIYKELEGSYQVKSIFPYERQRRFDVYEVVVEPGQSCEGLSKETGNCEYVMVNQGVLTLETEQRHYDIAAPHAVRICCEGEYSYVNYTLKPLIINVFVSYESNLI